MKFNQSHKKEKEKELNINNSEIKNCCLGYAHEGIIRGHKEKAKKKINPDHK